MTTATPFYPDEADYTTTLSKNVGTFVSAACLSLFTWNISPFLLLSTREVFTKLSSGMRKFSIIFTIFIVAMITHHTIGKEALVTEDGKVSAQTLPLDKESSKVSYETATFGIG